MHVTEQVEEQMKTQTGVPEVRPDMLPPDASVENASHKDAPVEDASPVSVHASPASEAQVPAVAPAVAWPVLNPAWLRLAYAFEFWIAVLAIFTLWSQVGGQGHLDLIAWYIKLACVLALAWSAVRMTGSMVENARAWNRTTVRWFVAVVTISTLIAGITYWYHLHEVADEPDTDENSATVVWNGLTGHTFSRDLAVRERAHS